MTDTPASFNSSTQRQDSPAPNRTHLTFFSLAMRSTARMSSFQCASTRSGTSPSTTRSMDSLAGSGFGFVGGFGSPSFFSEGGSGFAEDEPRRALSRIHLNFSLAVILPQLSGRLERVGLADYQHRQIGQLSGGQRKRAFLARCIAQGADLLLLDEPFAGVDKRSEATISTLLRDLASSGATILVSTHDLHTLPELADEAILLMQTVLLHSDPQTALQPQHLARAFGLDILSGTPGRP